MSIDSTSAAAQLYRKKQVSQSSNYPCARYSLKDRPQQSLINTRGISGTEDNSDDTLTGLSSFPYMPHKQENKHNRRFSELKPSLFPQNQATNSERRNSTPQIPLNTLLPNHFRSNKHQYKNATKDELNTSIDSSTNDSMASRIEAYSSSKILNGSRSNLSICSEHSLTMSHDDSPSTSFVLDRSQSEPRSTETFMLELNTPLSVAEIYRQQFLEYFHTNYCGEFQSEGPFIASLRCTQSQARAIIRIPSRNYDVSITIDGTNEDHILQELTKKVNLSTIQNYRPTSDPKANEKIYLFDKSNDERQNCKIGFIYQRSNQTEESDLFNNDLISEDMNDFLQILADRVRLKGFEKYRGDLDVKSDLHGEYSYYTQYNNREIMFNIAPMIPTTNSNGQCVKRKGLVGNSFVCIVFQENDAEFKPDFISGKVTQIYITVQPVKTNERIYYKVGIWHRPDLVSLIDPPGGIYESDKSFRDYFLTLLLNSINVAIESPSLRHCIADQRQRLKHEEMKKLSQTLCMRQNLETVSDVNNNHTYTREDSVGRPTTPGSNDGVVPNTGRVSPVQPKKRTLSKILSVFSRSGSISMSSTNDSSPTPPPVTETNTTSSRTASTSGREAVKRVASIKQRAAPLPPSSSRAPVAYKYSAPPPQSSTLPPSSSSSHVLSTFNSNNDKTLSQNGLLKASTYDDNSRNRSYSSPEENANTNKRPLSTVSSVSREVSDTGSSVYDSSDDELSDEEKFAHRPTIVEIPVILPPTPGV